MHGRDQVVRTTPACAGTTHSGAGRGARAADNPRVCGDDPINLSCCIVRRGQPPRVRGRHRALRRLPAGRGTTPACAGTTAATTTAGRRPWDNPRVCGDDDRGFLRGGDRGGQPPRVRGRQHTPNHPTHRLRTTPACAGTTARSRSQRSPGWDNPRVCGDDGKTVRGLLDSGGQPPRVRGRLLRVRSLTDRVGTTPACAGTTSTGTPRSTRPGDNPRVCGDDASRTREEGPTAGQPPRVRGRHGSTHNPRQCGRTTPACAGTTPGGRCFSTTREDNPRVCGDDADGSGLVAGAGGQPPRVRGRPVSTAARPARPRTTPACAGTTLEGP